jgi:acid phosphatase family membrane protein YuiD
MRGRIFSNISADLCVSLCMALYRCVASERWSIAFSMACIIMADGWPVRVC